MKIARRKYLTFCKHSSVNWMAAGSRLPRSSYGIFSPSPIFQTHLNIFKQAVGPGVLQAFSTYAIKH